MGGNYPGGRYVMTLRVREFAFLLCIFSTASSAQAQRAELTDKDIDDAIAIGLKAKGGEQGLELREGGFLRSTGAATTTGFVVVIYTPTTWVRQAASDAAKQYKAFTRADVTDDMRAPILRVIVHADTPLEMTPNARYRAASVEHVVLQDRKRTTAIQPLSLQPFEATVSNALGARETFQSQHATFSLAALQTLRGSADAEFVVTVVGSGADSLGRARNEKHFDVKRSELKRLP
jgi:hypothetical protein